jgi:peptide/nickel transport system substrate-binding protein
MSFSVIRFGRRAALATGSLLGLAACAPGNREASQAGSETASGREGGNVPDREAVFAISRDLGNGPDDPFFVHSSTMVWEPLVGLNDALKPVPALAERWDLSADARTWTFKLRPNVKFSDGTPFDAEAVVKNLQRYMKISPRPSPYFTMDVRVGYGKLAEVKPVDSLTVAVHLEEPAPFMPATMSNFFSAMYSPASFGEDGKFTGLPVATGPFKLLDWKRGEYLLLERNEQYWGAKPHVRRLRLRTIPDANARVSALQAREVDAVAELGALLPAQAQQLKGQPGITVGADPISITQYLAFNCSKPPFDDERMRRAVAMSTDRDGIVKDLVFGYGTAGKSLLAPFSAQWFSPKGTPRYAPAEAPRLAAEALGGRRAEVVFPFNASAGQARPYKQIAELLQQVLRPLGLDVKIQAMEGAALTDTTNRGEWHLRFGQQGWANGDPDFIFSRFIHSAGDYNATAKGGYKDDEADRLVVQGKQERDERRRFTIYERLQEIAARDVPVFALYHEHAPYAHRDTITGLKQRITYQPTLDTFKLVK